MLQDAELVKAVKAGDESAYTNLVERYQSLVFSIIRKVIRETSEAEELAQDVFIHAFKKIPDLREPEKFKPWLCRIALNMALNRCTKRKPILIGLECIDEQMNEVAVNDALTAMESESRNAIIRQAVQAISPDDRILLELYYVEEMSVAEISSITQLSMSSVKVKLHRIRKRLYSIINKIKS